MKDTEFRGKSLTEGEGWVYGDLRHYVKYADKADYTDNKVEYICRWLNHSFRPFSKSQREKYNLIRQKYEEYKIKNQSEISKNVNK